MRNIILLGVIIVSGIATIIHVGNMVFDYFRRKRLHRKLQEIADSAVSRHDGSHIPRNARR